MISKRNLKKLMNTHITREDEESHRGQEALKSGIAHFNNQYYLDK